MKRITTDSSGQDDRFAGRPFGLSKPVRVVLKIIFVTVVLLALGRQMLILSREWSERGMTLADVSVKPTWMALAMGAFLASQWLFSVYWGRLLACAGVTGTGMEVFRAYAVGTLGKYVPGKAFVILIRTLSLRSCRTSRLTVGLTVLYETVSMLAAGAVLASVCFFLVQAHQWIYGAGVGILAAVLIAALHPAVFGRLSRLAAVPFRKTGEAFPAKGCFAVLLRWGIVSVVGWLLLGVSFWAVANSIGMPGRSWSDLASLTGAAALATAAGFAVVFIPAGLGVRELVMIHLLTARYGSSAVVVASLLLRTVWTAGEVLLAGALYWFPPAEAELAGGPVSGTALHGAMDRGAVQGSTSRESAGIKFSETGDARSVRDAQAWLPARVQPNVALMEDTTVC